jgi:broad specificity phosphatase PhoE
MWIYIVRHGETDGNRNRIVQTPHTPLSALGQEQARQFANAYAHISASHILSSDYTRAKSTALALHEKINCPFSVNELLRERNFGELRGQAYDNIADDFFAEDYHPKGGESHAQFISRIKHAWQYITEFANEQKGDLVVVTHGLVLRSLLFDILNLPKDSITQADIKNTCVTKISKQDHSNIALLCDAAHLAALNADARDVNAPNSGAV